MASIREVAKRAGVSIATVSRVINGAENVDPALRRNVMRAVEACEYTPTVGRKPQDAIALVYTGPFTAGSPYDSAAIDGMVEAMRDTPCDLILVDVHRDRAPDETLRQFFTRKGIRAAILRCTVEQHAMVARFAQEGLPLVVLGDHFPCEGVRFLYADSSSASREAVEHLVSLGHRRIAFAACEREDGDHLDRLKAYTQVIDGHGMFDPKLVCRVPPHRIDGRQLLRNLLGMPNRPTAIYIADPLVAVGAIIEAHSIGVRLPEDLSIIGFDDSDLRLTIWPRMTAVCQDARLLGAAAFSLAFELASTAERSILREKDSGSRTQSAWLELGNTTGPPPASPDRFLPTGTRLPG